VRRADHAIDEQQRMSYIPHASLPHTSTFMPNARP
jgi:hypothetical protein